MNPALKNSGTDALGIREVAQADAIESYRDLSRRFGVQVVEPLAKRAPTIGGAVFANVDHSLCA